jgi:hypothetical protein
MMSADITPAKGAFHSREQSAAPPTELAAGRVPANSRTVDTIELVAL